jgi:endonuclease/exonuclease/phosphatase (EEP) superfamily protein YafD
LKARQFDQVSDFPAASMDGCAPIGLAMKDFFSVRISFAGLLLWLGAFVCFFTTSGFFGRVGWLCELTSHFRVQYAVCLLMLGAFLCLKKKFRIGAVFTAFAAANLIVIVPCFLGARPPGDFGGHTLRVMLLNVRTENERYDLVVASIKKFRPDLVVIEEVNERWLKELARLREDYPHVKHEARDDNFGIALFSRLPFEDAEIVYLGRAEVPSVTVRLVVAGRKLTILGTHPLPPGSLENFRLRNEQLDAVATFVRKQPNPLIVLGDFNVTPWSYYFERLVKEGGLTDSSAGRGIHATWPAAGLPLRIPIDHCLVSAEVGIASKIIGGNVGSGHLPVVVDLVLPSAVSREQ